MSQLLSVFGALLVSLVPSTIGSAVLGSAAPGSAVLGSAVTSIRGGPSADSTGLQNGSFDAGLSRWFTSNRADATSAVVVVGGDDPELDLIVSASGGSLAQDIAVAPQAGRTYEPTVRVSSPTGLPVLVALAVHALSDGGTIGESASRLVMVEGDEVPITVGLRPLADHASLRVELYVHTVGRHVRIDDAGLAIDGDHNGPWNYGYQQPRVRYLDGVDPTRLEPGAGYRIEVAVGTTTDQPWSCCSASGSVRLGTEDADGFGGSDRASQLFVPGDVDGSRWLSPTRIALDEPAGAAQHRGGTFTTIITAPTGPGPFAESFRLVAEGVTWIPGPPIVIVGEVGEPTAPASGSPAIDVGNDGGHEVAGGAGAGDPGPVREAPIPAAGRCPSPPPIQGLSPGLCPPVPGGEPPVPGGGPPVPGGGPGGVPGVPGGEPPCGTVEVRFEQPVLLRYTGADTSTQTAVDLSCARYRVQLRSTDERHEPGYQPDQVQERWFLEGLGADGTVIYTSPPTPDLLADLTEAIFEAGSADLQGVVSFRAHHLGTGRSANSVEAGAVLIGES